MFKLQFKSVLTKAQFCYDMAYHAIPFSCEGNIVTLKTKYKTLAEIYASVGMTINRSSEYIVLE